MNGFLCSTSDVDMVRAHHRNGDKIIYVADPTGDTLFIKECNMIVSGMGDLVPPVNILEKDIDGRPLEFDLMYEEYLKTGRPSETFAVILSALYHGSNVVLYFPKSCSENLRYPLKLLRFIQSDFGIITATKSSPYDYNMAYHDKNLNMMLYYNTISPVEYLYSFNGPIEGELVNILSSGLGIKPQDNYDSQKNMLLEYQSNMRKDHKLLQQGIVYNWEGNNASVCR